MRNVAANPDPPASARAAARMLKAYRVTGELCLAVKPLNVYERYPGRTKFDVCQLPAGHDGHHFSTNDEGSTGWTDDYDPEAAA